LVETVAMNFYAAEFPSATTLAREGKRATKLLRDLRAGDAGSAARFRYNHPRFAWMTDEAVRQNARMTDARFVAAREYGFSSWARLREHLEALGGKREVRHPFETGLQYYRDRAAGMLSVFGTGERNAVRLVRLFHPDYAAAPESEIRAARLTQTDAELILAREHGFETFDAFGAYIEALRGQRVSEPFALAFAAIKADDRARLNELLALHPRLPNAAGTNGNRLLLLALSFGRTAMVHDLLDAGADPDLPNNKGWTALHQAAYADPAGDPAGALAMLDALLKAGASPFAEAYGDGGTPLAVALFWGHRVLAEGLAKPVVAPSSLRVAAGLGRLDLMDVLRGQKVAAGGALASRIPPATLGLSALAAERRCGGNSRRGADLCGAQRAHRGDGVARRARRRSRCRALQRNGAALGGGAQRGRGGRVAHRSWRRYQPPRRLRRHARGHTAAYRGSMGRQPGLRAPARRARRGGHRQGPGAQRDTRRLGAPFQQPGDRRDDARGLGTAVRIAYMCPNKMWTA